MKFVQQPMVNSVSIAVVAVPGSSYSFAKVMVD